MMEQTTGLGGCRKSPWPQFQPRLTQAHRLSAHLARQAGGLRTAGSAHRRQHVSARGAIGALERLRWTGSVHAVAHQASWTPHGGSSPRAGAALHCFYCCDRGSTQLGVGEIPAQQCGGLQVADLAERSGVP
jgi:hypothetical protein